MSSRKSAVSIPLISGLFDYACPAVSKNGGAVSIPLISGLFDYGHRVLVWCGIWVSIPLISGLFDYATTAPPSHRNFRFNPFDFRAF